MDITTGTWSKKADAKFNRQNHSLVAIQSLNGILSIGGA
jgi:hypothetical protein